MRHCLALCLVITLSLGLSLTQTAHAQTGWIGDTLFVPVRAGAGNNYRIVHRGLRTGTRVEILSWEQGADWANIRNGDTEGWVETQYLSRSPIAQVRLEQAQQAATRMEQQLATARSELAEVTAERDQLAGRTRELDQNLSQRGEELEKLQEVAADPMRLDRANRQLNEELSLLRTELDQVRAENTQLRNDKTFRGWMFALLTIFGGMLLGWYFKSRSSRQRTSWV